MIVQSFGELTNITERRRPYFAGSGGGASLGLYGFNQTYFQLYKTQPNVRICVDFLARNIAQLGLKTFRRVSDTDRVRLNDHELARWLKRPNPWTTTYRLIEDLVIDLGIYYRAYWLKIRYIDGAGRRALGFVRLPPDEVTEEGALFPTEFIWTVGGKEKRFLPSEIVHLTGYARGISPLETLRNILAEEASAGEYREQFWTNGARFEGVWERDKSSKPWTNDQKQEWRKHWQEFSTNAKAGMTAVGNPGMVYKEVSHTAKDSEYVAGGKLRREVCAAAYHIPQPLVGILEHATFSNIRAQHEHLYQDTLGPWNENITQEIERQALVECDDQENVYTEFNVDAKLAGTPIDRAQSLQLSVGRPWVTVNEARAIDNKPRIDDPEFDRPAPQQGGPSDASAGGNVSTADQQATAVAEVIHSARLRQLARLQKVNPEDRADAFLASLDRWNREISEDLTPIVGAEAAESYALIAHGKLLGELKAQAYE